MRTGLIFSALALAALLGLAIPALADGGDSPGGEGSFFRGNMPLTGWAYNDGTHDASVTVEVH